MKFSRSKRLELVVSIMTFGSAIPVAQADQSDAKGFLADSTLTAAVRSLYFNRDFHNKDAAHSYSSDTGIGVTTRFTSGFTAGVVGLGLDAFSIEGLKLDSGRGTNSASTFPKDSSGRTEEGLSKLGAAVKMRVSRTELKYGNQFFSLPLLATDQGRFLSETMTGYLLTSRELPGLELNAAHVTALSSKYASGYDSKNLREADVVGGVYKVSKNLSLALYYSDIQDNYKKKYANLTYVRALDPGRTLTTVFNVYRSDSQGQELSGYVDNTLWSIASTYAVRSQSFTLAYQNNVGNTGYAYGADGGATYVFANSVQYSDFNAKDEGSWQVRYDLDFAASGVPGLNFMIRYISGDGISTRSTSDGKEWERNESLRYVVQSGVAKNLGLQIRHAKNHSSALNRDLDETRVIVDYPINVF